MTTEAGEQSFLSEYERRHSDDYASQVRIILKKYLVKNKVGVVSFLKLHLYPTFSQAEIDEFESSLALNIKTLTRRLQYWVGDEEGDIKNPKIVGLIEEFFRRRNPESLSQFNSHDYKQRMGSALSEFVSIDEASEDIHRFQKKDMEWSFIEPGSYVLVGIHELTGEAGIERFSFEGMEKMPHTILTIEDTLRENYRSVSIARLSKRWIQTSTDPTGRALVMNPLYWRRVGFYFPRSTQDLIVVKCLVSKMTDVFACANLKHVLDDTKIKDAELPLSEYYFSLYPTFMDFYHFNVVSTSRMQRSIYNVKTEYMRKNYINHAFKLKDDVNDFLKPLLLDV